MVIVAVVTMSSSVPRYKYLIKGEEHSEIFYYINDMNLPEELKVAISLISAEDRPKYSVNPPLVIRIISAITPCPFSACRSPVKDS